MSCSGSTSDDELREFLELYQDPIAGLIAQIHAYPDPDDYQDRFIILSLVEHGSSYVQFAFDTADREGLCEAASGAFAAPDERPHFESAQLQRLSQLGFSMDDAKENLRKRFRFSSEPDSFAPNSC
jgi:hypothetical protein